MPPLPQPFSNTSVADWVTQLQRAEAAEDRLRALQAISLLAPSGEVACWATHSLQDPDATVRALAAKLLGTAEIILPPEIAAKLVALLEDEDPDARFESARALLRRKSGQQNLANRVLLAFLDEEETQPLMIAAIINALVDAGSIDHLTEAELQPRLKRQLENERAEVREAVATAFARWPTLCNSLVDQLLPLLDDSEPVVREKIAEALGHAGIVNEKIRTALQAACQDEDSEVARIAAFALKQLSSG